MFLMHKLFTQVLDVFTDEDKLKPKSENARGNISCRPAGSEERHYKLLLTWKLLQGMNI